MRQHRTMKASALVAACVASIAGVPGCSWLQSPDNLVTTHLAVLSVEDFESARRKLSPNFKLSGDDAFKLVNPTIGVGVNLRSESTRTGVELGLDITPDALGLGGSEAPALPGPSARSPVFKPPETFKDALDQASTLRTSRALEYQLAQSIFEQVSMLNATVASAAVPKGYKGYIVQLQLGILPRKMNVQRDVYADIAFFAVSKLKKEDTRLLDHMEAFQEKGVNGNMNVTRTVSRRIRVVPLLSTDSLESVVNAASLDKLQAFSMSLKLAADRVNAGGSFEDVLQEISAGLGKQIFSSYSVAKLTENTLRARFGAVPNGTGYVAVPRTHRIPVLLLLPDDLACELGKNSNYELLASAKTALFDPESGKQDKPVDFKYVLLDGVVQVAPYFSTIMGRNLIDLSKDAERLVELASLVQENSFQEFVDKLQCLVKDMKCRENLSQKEQLIAEISPESVWIEMSSVVTRTEFSGARFTVVKPDPVKLAAPKALVVQDDGKTWVITLPGIPADRIKPSEVQLTAGAYGPLGAEAILEGPGGVARAVFPPLKPVEGMTVAITLGESAIVGKADSIPLRHVSIKPPPTDSKPLLVSSTKIINKSTGTATVVVDFRSFGERKLPSFFLKCEKATILDPGAKYPSLRLRDDGTIEVTREGAYTLTLNGLDPGTDVTFSAIDADGRALAVDGKEYVFHVVE